MLAGALLATVPLLVAPGAPPAGPLDADVVDTSTFPTVSIDFIVPPPLHSLTITSQMVELGGASVVSVAPVDPRGIVVSLVIDDGPTVPPAVVNDAQGASVELVRNVGAGTKIALSTPSGLQTALTSDRRANIARIAGITAEAPDVVPLPGLILEAATRLAASTETDRHLVLVLGSTPAVDLDVLRAVVEAGGIEVHLVAPDGLDLDGLAELADSSGGVVPSMPALVGEIDAATAAIAQRYRVEATVEAGGPRELAVVVDGARHVATVDIPSPAVVASTSTSSTTSTTSPTSTTSAPRPTTAIAVTSPSATTAATSSSGGGSAIPAILIGAFVALAIAAVALWAVRRRRGGDDEEVDAVVLAAPPPKPEPVATEPEPVATPPAPAAIEPEPAPARPARAAAARPRRSVSTRRTEPVPATDLESLPVESDDEEPVTEWLVTGDLRLRRATGEAWSGKREVALSPAERGVLELLMTSGDRGVTPEAIAEAAARYVEDDEAVDPDAVLARLRRKTRLGGGTMQVRKERAMLYFFDDDAG
jgi:hypothetical protein